MEKEKEENMENKDAVQLYLSSVKAVLEKLGEFLTEKNNQEHQIQEERNDISEKIEIQE